MRLEGFKELDRALGELPKATAKNVLKRTLMKAANPMQEDAEALAPEDTGKLRRSVIVGTKLTRSQKTGGAVRTAGGYRSAAKNYVEVHVGTAMSRGIFMEFGTFKDSPVPFLGPAWDINKDKSLGIIKVELGTQIEKAAKRLAKKRGL